MRSTSVRVAAAATAFVFATGCASTTLIKSYPPGARVYLDGEPAGTTPYPMSDQKIVGSATRVKLVLEGHEPYEAIIQRNEQFDAGACVGGLLVLFPFLWIMGYKPEHNYELTPMRGPMAAPPGYVPAPQAPGYAPQQPAYPQQQPAYPQQQPAYAPQQPAPATLR